MGPLLQLPQLLGLVDLLHFNLGLPAMESLLGNTFFMSEIVDPLARIGGSQYADFWSSGGFLSFYFAESFPYSQANYFARGSVIIDTVTLNSVFSSVKPRSRGFRLFLFMITKLYFVLSKCRTAD